MSHTLGKGEVESSILSHSTIKPQQMHADAASPNKLLCADMGANDSGTAAQIWHKPNANSETPLSAWDLIESDPERWHSPTWLYRYFNSYDVLLYVGISFDVHTRDYAHYCATAWRPAAVWMTAELFPSRSLAEAAEEIAIRDEDPMANRRRKTPCEIVPVRDQWFVDCQGGIIGCRKTTMQVHESRLRHPRQTH